MTIDRLFIHWLLVTICFVTSASAALAADDECGEPHTRDRSEILQGSPHDARHAQVLEGALSWVADGDSIWVRVDGQEVEVRLADIDSPERDQPYGWEAKLGLIDLLRGRHLKLVPHDVDRHGRIVARVWVDDVDVSRELVSRGLAWFYRAYGRDFSLRCEERRARAEGRGLWAQPSPQAPWAHRREKDHQDRDRGK